MRIRKAWYIVLFWTLTEDGVDGQSDGLQVSMIVVLLLLQVEPSLTNLNYFCVTNAHFA